MVLTFESGTRFLDPDKMLFQIGLASGGIAADLGVGSGFFSIAAAKIVGSQGAVFAVDIMEQSLAHLASEARLKGLSNLRAIRADLEQPDCCDQIPAGQVDVVILANILHQITNQPKLLRDTYGLLKTGGRVLLIEWNERPSPIGPPSPVRLVEAKVQELFAAARFKPGLAVAADRYHYSYVFEK